MRLPETTRRSVSYLMLGVLGASALSSCKESSDAEYCYAHKLRPGAVSTDVMHAIESNFHIDGTKIDLKNLSGLTTASENIAAKLAALHHRIGDGSVEGADSGDVYTYCLAPDGTITAGHHGYSITNPK